MKTKISEETCRRWVVKLQAMSVLAMETYESQIEHGMPRERDTLLQFAAYCEEQAEVHAQMLNKFYQTPQIIKGESSGN